MGEAARQVVAVPLAAEAWADFGWLPVDDTDPEDGRHRLTFSWQDPHLNVIAHSSDEVTRRGTALHCDTLYHHLTHSQALLVLDAPAAMAVAPPTATFTTPADAGQIRAFLLRPLDAFVLHPGTWHWGPFPVETDQVRLYNLQGLRYQEDNLRADLEGVGAAVDVIVG